MQLGDRGAIVTGASRGIGAAIVEAFAARGATVIASAHAADDPEDLVARLTAEAAAVHSHIADVTDPEQVQTLADWTQREFGRIDVLANNAGVGAVVPSEDLSLERWSRVMAVNLTGPLLCSQAVAPAIPLAAGRGVIINIGSIFGETGMPMRAAYAASKHGLVGLTRVLAVEWASRGVRVVAVERPTSAPASMLEISRMGATGPRTSWLARPWGAMASRPRSPLPSRSWPAMTRHSSPARASRSTEAGWPMAAGRPRRLRQATDAM